MAGRIVVGTSSWADPGFVAEWYPQGLPARERLPWYAERFEAVEVNSSFYAVPDPGLARRWAQVTPPSFSFDVKLHRLLSRHGADLASLPGDLRSDAETTDRGRVRLTPRLEAAVADRLLEAVAPLEDAGKLATLLLQLSPAFAPRAHALDELAPLLARLAPRRVAVELRHRGWVEDEALERTLGFLEEHGAAFVCTDGPQGRAPTMMPPVDGVTRDDLAYVRAHGRNAEGYLRGRTVAERFGHVYAEDELRGLRERLEGLAREVAEVRMMFNNNRGDDAPRAARRLRQLLGQDPGPPPERAPAQASLL
jgi:uncharacterized protein YecE (DUF72 family)